MRHIIHGNYPGCITEYVDKNNSRTAAVELIPYRARQCHFAANESEFLFMICHKSNQSSDEPNRI